MLDRPELDTILADVIAEAQRAFPTIALPADVFVTYLGDRIPADVPRPLALRQLHTADLYLACACALGDANGFAAFEDRCLRHLDRALRKLDVDTAQVDEIKQDIRSRVLIGESGRPRIVAYSGRGDLRSWVRVIAVRHALQRWRRTRREVAFDDDELFQRIGTCDHPEMDYLKELYRREFRQAFEAAWKTVPARERTLLRQHYLDGLTVDELGGLYRVHRSTAARLVVRARVAVLEATRARLMAVLDVPPRELDSILRMIRSQIEISVRVLHHRRR